MTVDGRHFENGYIPISEAHRLTLTKFDVQMRTLLPRMVMQRKFKILEILPADSRYI